MLVTLGFHFHRDRMSRGNSVCNKSARYRRELAEILVGYNNVQFDEIWIERRMGTDEKQISCNLCQTSRKGCVRSNLEHEGVFCFVR